MSKLKLTAYQRQTREIWKQSARQARKAGVAVPYIKDLPKDYKFTRKEAHALEKATREVLKATREAQNIIEQREVKPQGRYNTEERKARHREQQRAYRERMKALTPQDLKLLQLAKSKGLKGINSTNIKQFKEYLQTMGSINNQGKIYQHRLQDAIDQLIDSAEQEGRSVSSLLSDYQTYAQDIAGTVQSATKGYAYSQYADYIKRLK